MAARGDVGTVSRFTIRNNGWNSLTPEEKENIVELWEREQDAKKTATPAGEV